MRIPDEVKALKNTHLLTWLEDGYGHCQRGSKEWCQAYLDSAKEYIEALETLVAESPTLLPYHHDELIEIRANRPEHSGTITGRFTHDPS